MSGIVNKIKAKVDDITHKDKTRKESAILDIILN